MVAAASGGGLVRWRRIVKSAAHERGPPNLTVGERLTGSQPIAVAQGACNRNFQIKLAPGGPKLECDIRFYLARAPFAS
jgi:hypothetical protein